MSDGLVIFETANRMAHSPRQRQSPVFACDSEDEELFGLSHEVGEGGQLIYVRTPPSSCTYRPLISPAMKVNLTDASQT